MSGGRDEGSPYNTRVRTRIDRRPTHVRGVFEYRPAVEAVITDCRGVVRDERELLGEWTADEAAAESTARDVAAEVRRMAAAARGATS